MATNLEATERVFVQKEETVIRDRERYIEAQRLQDERWGANKEILGGLKEQVVDLGLEEKLGDVSRRIRGEYADFKLLPVNWANHYEGSPLAIAGFVIAKHYTGSAWPNRNPDDYYFQAVLFAHNDHDLDAEGNPLDLPSNVGIAIGKVSDSGKYSEGGNHVYDKIAQMGEGADVWMSPYFAFTPQVETRTVTETRLVKGLIFTRNRSVEVQQPHVVHKVGSFRIGSEPFFPGEKDRYIGALDKKLAAFVAKEHHPRIRYS